jgi:hypothetical protein
LPCKMSTRTAKAPLPSGSLPSTLCRAFRLLCRAKCRTAMPGFPVVPISTPYFYQTWIMIIRLKRCTLFVSS